MFSTARSLWSHWDLYRVSQRQHGGLSPGLAFPSIVLFPPSLWISAVVSTTFWEKGYFWVCEWGGTCGAPDFWEAWLRTLSLPVFGSTFGMGQFPAERRKPNCMASLIGSCYSCPHLGCISMTSYLCGVFWFMLFILWQSQWGHLEKNEGIGVWQSSGWVPAPAPPCCEALDLSLYVPDLHLPCEVFGGLN